MTHLNFGARIRRNCFDAKFKIKETIKWNFISLFYFILMSSKCTYSHLIECLKDRTKWLNLIGSTQTHTHNLYHINRNNQNKRDKNEASQHHFVHHIPYNFGWACVCACVCMCACKGMRAKKESSFSSSVITWLFYFINKIS